MVQLESIVESLETGETPLTELVEKYEKGTRLIEQCRAKLGDAELRIRKIEDSGDGFKLESMPEPE